MCLAQLCIAAKGILELIFLELFELEYSRTSYQWSVDKPKATIILTHMLQGSKHSVHLPNRIVNLEIQRLEDQVKQNIWIRRDMFPCLGAHEVGDPLPQSRGRSEAHQGSTSIQLDAEEESQAMPTVVCLGKFRKMVPHLRRAVVDFRSIISILDDIDVLAEEVEPCA